MRKGIFYTVICCMLLFGPGCSKDYISYQSKTSMALRFYNHAIANNYSFVHFRDSLCNGLRVVPGGKMARRKRNPFHQAAYNEIVNQRTRLDKVDPEIRDLFEDQFGDNACIRTNGLTVFTRKLIVPQTEYSHLSTPFRNESYVFYIFNDYNPETGMGRYYQTDAYYPRDAFSLNVMDLCPDNPHFSKRLEFFTGVFYLSYNDILRQPVLCLLSPLNNLNDRKVFTVDVRDETLRFTKAFDYKLSNFYPIMDGHYTLEQQRLLTCKRGNTTRSIFEKEIHALNKLNVSNALFTLQNKNDSIIPATRDYFYPLKGKAHLRESSGWVYFGTLGKDGNKVTNETFLQYRKWGGLFDNNKEIKTMKRVDLISKKVKTVKSFDVIKIRNTPNEAANVKGMPINNFDDITITGETHPDTVYHITGVQLVGDFVWIHITKAPPCKKLFRPKKRATEGRKPRDTHRLGDEDQEETW